MGGVSFQQVHPMSEAMRKVRRAMGMGALLATALLATVACKSKEQQQAEDWQSACNSGTLGACADLGEAYAHGIGVPVNPGRAIELYERACTGNFAHGCGLLGKAYADGTGVSKDSVKARELLSKACGSGDRDSCAGACELGDAERCLPVALLAAQGGKDLARAAVYYRKGCDFGHPLACREAARMYQDGQGIAKDTAEAGRLLKRADELMKVACAGATRPDYCDEAAGETGISEGPR